MNDLADLYKIGTVAKLTGIAVERLRAWERRYGLTPASRDGKTRYFSGEQVERLTRIKRLIDQGHPVSTLINLDNSALNERLQSIVPKTTAAPASGTAASIANVGLVGTQLLMLEQSQTSAPRFNVTGRWVNLAVCLPQLNELQQHSADAQNTTVGNKGQLAGLPEVLIVLQGSLTPDSLGELQAIPATCRVLVVYHYATEAGLASAAEQNFELLRWPASWSDVEAVVARISRSPLRAGARTGRHFSDEQLLSIASAGSGLGCACPADLVNLISALNAFSDHSAACTDSAANPGSAAPIASPHRNTATRHAQVAERTSAARLELELVLQDWVQAEGLLPAPN